MSARRPFLALAIIMPALAVGAFALAPPVQADCEASPSQCCYNSQSFSLGSCMDFGQCWIHSNMCVQGGVDAYWGTCNC